jgi:hypothetical protein
MFAKGSRDVRQESLLISSPRDGDSWRLEPIAWGRWQAVPEAAAPLFAHAVGGDNSGANGIERDVIADPGEI